MESNIDRFIDQKIGEGLDDQEIVEMFSKGMLGGQSGNDQENFRT
jgi:hypothetical protein